MRSVQPEVFLVAQPAIDYDQLAAYLREVGGEQWLERLDRGELASGEQASDAQNLAEFAGKMCYRAWEPGLNPNVRRVRNDHEACHRSHCGSSGWARSRSGSRTGPVRTRS
jgi:thymidylate synthase (FAD)